MKQFFGLATLILSAIAGYITVTRYFPLMGVALTLMFFAKGMIYLLEGNTEKVNHEHIFMLNWSDGEFWAECECGETISLESDADRESAYGQMYTGDRIWKVEQ